MSLKGKSVYFIAGGTRGDCQPLALCGLVLKSRGCKVVLCTGEENKGFADEMGFGFVQISSVKKALTTHEGCLEAQRTGDIITTIGSVTEITVEGAPSDLKAITSAIDSDECEFSAIIATSTHNSLPYILQDVYPVFAFSMVFYPMFVNTEFPPFFIDERVPATWQNLPNPDGSTPGPFAKSVTPPRAAYPVFWENLMDQFANAMVAVGAAFSKTLGREPSITLEMTKKQMKGIADSKYHPYVSAVTMLATPDSADFAVQKEKYVSGAILDHNQDSCMHSFPANLEKFLNNGDAPIYFGWGSMGMKDNSSLVRAAIGTCKRLGKRGIICKGWAGLSLDMLDSSTEPSNSNPDTETITTVKTQGRTTTTVTTTVSTSADPSISSTDADLIEYANAGNILFLDNVSHSKLFPKCCCLVTHGGMGTFSAMLNSGTPGVITPAWWDQIFTGDRIEYLSCGKRGPHFSKLTEKNLSPLVESVLNDDSYASRCAEVGKAIRAEAGDVKLADIIENGIKNLKK